MFSFGHCPNLFNFIDANIYSKLHYLNIEVELLTIIFVELFLSAVVAHIVVVAHIAHIAVIAHITHIAVVVVIVVVAHIVVVTHIVVVAHIVMVACCGRQGCQGRIISCTKKNAQLFKDLTFAAVSTNQNISNSI